MTSSLDEKKDIASQWFRSLRDQFCVAFEELDGGKFCLLYTSPSPRDDR